MGATVSVSRRAAAFQDKVLWHTWYALFENTYESNCWPHTPRESCVAFGDEREVLRQVLNYSADTCGGMLQGPGGWISARGYIKSWLKALASPVVLHNQTVTLPGLAIGGDNLEHVLAKLRSKGFVTAADKLEQGIELRTTIHDDPELIAALCEGGGYSRVSPWRLVDPPYSRETNADAECAMPYDAAPRKSGDRVMLATLGVEVYGQPAVVGFRAKTPVKPQFWALGTLHDVQAAFIEHVARDMGNKDAYPCPQFAINDVLAHLPVSTETRFALNDDTMMSLDFNDVFEHPVGTYYTDLANKTLAPFAAEDYAGPNRVCATWGRIRELCPRLSDIDNRLKLDDHGGPTFVEVQSDKPAKPKRPKVAVGQRWHVASGVSMADGTPVEQVTIVRPTYSGRQWVVDIGGGMKCRMRSGLFTELATAGGEP